MKIAEQLLAALPEEPVAIKKVLIGVHWTIVTSLYSGMASTMVNSGPHGVSQIRDVSLLHQKSAQELAQWIYSDNLLEASLGLAAINSLIGVDEHFLTDVNAVDVIKQKAMMDKNLAIVGHFPFVDKIKHLPKTCWVIEKNPIGEDFPEAASRDLLPQADIVAITATTLINHSIEDLLSYCRPDATVILLGPSTPLLPELFNFGISYLSGSRVVDEASAILSIQQGATFQQVKGVRLVTMASDRWVSGN